MVLDEEGERLTEMGGAELPQPAAAARRKIDKNAKPQEEIRGMPVLSPKKI
jgi:hypothetical protein